MASQVMAREVLPFLDAHDCAHLASASPRLRQLVGPTNSARYASQYAELQSITSALRDLYRKAQAAGGSRWIWRRIADHCPSRMTELQARRGAIEGEWILAIQTGRAHELPRACSLYARVQMLRQAAGAAWNSAQVRELLQLVMEIAPDHGQIVEIFRRRGRTFDPQSLELLQQAALTPARENPCVVAGWSMSARAAPPADMRRWWQTHTDTRTGQARTRFGGCSFDFGDHGICCVGFFEENRTVFYLHAFNCEFDDASGNAARPSLGTPA